tara:strand:- start:653 stop:1684 length:1032 start_codon:yes stop_codon:yes gene_type:complete
MKNKFDSHFILIDKCAEETRIAEILDGKIIKCISWFDNNIPIIGNQLDAFVVKKLHGGLARARLNDKSLVTIRGTPKSLKENSLVKILITSEKFDNKPIQAKLVDQDNYDVTKLEYFSVEDKVIAAVFTRGIPILNDKYAIYWEMLNLDQQYLNALEPKVHLAEGGLLWIEKTKAATLIDVDTDKLKIHSIDQLYFFCLSIFDKCLKEIKLRNIGGMILVDFPRLPLSKRKLLHQKFTNIGKNTFVDGSFLGFSKLLLYEIYIPRKLRLLGEFYQDNSEFTFQNYLRSIWRKSKEMKSKNNIQFICGKDLYNKIKTKITPEYIKIVERQDLPHDYGELVDLRL